jgi:hypothetical protein
MADKTSVIAGPKQVVVKTRSCSIADTTARQIATLPKGSRLIAFVINGVASDALTTATLSFGNTVTATEYTNGQDVKTAASGVGPTLAKGVSGVLGAVLTSDTPIYVKYAETGTAATVGSWKVSIVYSTGNYLFDDTI